MEHSFDEMIIVFASWRFASSMFVSVLERFGGRIELVWEEKCHLNFSERSNVWKTLTFYKNQHHLVGTQKNPLQHGPKTEKSVSPSELGGFFVTPKLPWCFFVIVVAYQCLWHLLGTLAIPFSPRGILLGLPEILVNLARCGVILTSPPCAARWWTSGFSICLCRNLRKWSGLTCADVSTRWAIVFHRVKGNWLSPILIFWWYPRLETNHEFSKKAPFGIDSPSDSFYIWYHPKS